MTEIRISDEQNDRFEALKTELAETQVGKYATVRDEDVLRYLLDLADAVEDPERQAIPEIPAGGDISAESGSGDSSDVPDTDDADVDESTAAGAEADTADENDGKARLNAMMNLLDTHDDKWRQGDGEARYEVDLPDGDTETAQTKDDVRALLFKNY